MKRIVTAIILTLAVLAPGCAVQEKSLEAPVFSYETGRLTDARPWTVKEFRNKPDSFQFVIIGDRTGGAKNV